MLRDHVPERAVTEPEVVARHAEAAGRADDAIAYYGRAGERAQARSAHGEAIGQLGKAIVILATQPAGEKRDDHELSLQLTLATSLIAARGYGHTETAMAYERAVVLAAALGHASRLGEARLGLSISYFTSGELERGRALAAEVLATAEARGDQAVVVVGHGALAACAHYQGRFAASLASRERAIALYDSGKFDAHARMLGHDQPISSRAFAAWNLWYLGRPDAALARVHDVVTFAQRLEHPFSLAFALFFQTVIHVFRGEVAAHRDSAAQVVALGEAHGFPLWLGVGRTYDAAARVAAGDAAAVTEVLAALAPLLRARHLSGAPGLLWVVADAQRAAGQIAEAQGTVAAALAMAAETSQPFQDAHLHCLDADLLLVAGGSADEVAARYRRSLAIAREQGARSLELRAATGLARLWCDQGKRAEARALLAPVYGWFTEGFATRDLIDAKALLDELT